MTIRSLLSVIVTSVLSLHSPASGQSPCVEECTIGVASGRGTSDGRPLLWKTRDSNETDNEVKYNTSCTHKFICVSGAGSSTLSWMGVNEHGFSIVNSTSADLVANGQGPDNGSLMRDVLGNCKSIAEFQQYLDSTNITGRATQANFGVIDSTGAAAIFETGGNVYFRFDANSSENGYIIRTNFSWNGGGNSGMERYNTSSELIYNFFTGDSLNYKSILRTQMREFSDINGLPLSLPFAGTWATGFPFGYIYCDLSICRPSSVSAAVIHGVLPSENPGLTTLWAMLGQPASTVALPYWPVGNTPTEADGPATSLLCDKAKEIRALLFDYSLHGGFIDSYKLSNGTGKGLWTCLFPLEDQLFDQTAQYLDSLRGSGTLPALSMIAKEADNARYVSEQLQNCRNSIALSVDELASHDHLIIYPNPAKERFFVDCHDNRVWELSLENLTGKRLLQKRVSNGAAEVYIGSLAKGVYIVRLNGGGSSIQQKLIKN